MLWPAPFVHDREDVMRALWWTGTANGVTAWTMCDGEGGFESINFTTRRFRIALGASQWFTGTYCDAGHHHYDE